MSLLIIIIIYRNLATGVILQRLKHITSKEVSDDDDFFDDSVEWNVPEPDNHQLEGIHVQPHSRSNATLATLY